MEHGIEDMICYFVQHGFEQAHAPLYEKIKNDSKRALFRGAQLSQGCHVRFGQLEGTISVE